MKRLALVFSKSVVRTKIALMIVKMANFMPIIGAM